jgi:hypothetical protein
MINWTYNHWKWEECALSKRRAPITHWRSSMFPKNRLQLGCSESPKISKQATKQSTKPIAKHITAWSTNSSISLLGQTTICVYELPISLCNSNFLLLMGNIETSSGTAELCYSLSKPAFALRVTSYSSRYTPTAGSSLIVKKPNYKFAFRLYPQKGKTKSYPWQDWYWTACTVKNQCLFFLSARWLVIPSGVLCDVYWRQSKLHIVMSSSAKCMNLTESRCNAMEPTYEGTQAYISGK